LGFAALAGLLSGSTLPVSLFPNSSKPTIWVEFRYGNGTADEFLNTYGRNIESALETITVDGTSVETVRAKYDRREVEYEVEFKWGAQAKRALRETQMVMNAFAAQMPEDVRNSMWVGMSNKKNGFIAISFFSPVRTLDELYEILDPVLMPRVSKVADADNPGLWNPSKKEVRVELDPAKMAALQLFPKDVDAAVRAALSSYSGGGVTIGTKLILIDMPKQADAIEQLSKVLIRTPTGQLVHLGDVAKVDFALKVSETRRYKTDGAPSLMLFSTPRPGGNVKRMSEDILDIVRDVMPSLPKDIRYRVLVDPSEFIRSAIHNVFHEVAIGALLAVAVLFLFIGSFRNTVTAAIEIPLSMVLAFILMKLSGMNVNLISLGGLALSAGMNVDASVVVMENIFRHFDHERGPFTFERRLEIVLRAVGEVRFAVIASTLASLVVFLPLAFTSDLSYAILGDLAKTVVFSHGFSAFVALILVPTVRLQLMSRDDRALAAGKGPAGEIHSPIEGLIRRLESAYGRALGYFISSPKLRLGSYLGIAVALGALAITILPRLPRELVGRPDTDWVMLGINTSGNTLIAQMESTTAEVEGRLLKTFGSKIDYTFTQIWNVNEGAIMARLKDKADMKSVWEGFESEFPNTPLLNYWVEPWNPSELPIPDPPQLRIAVRGGSLRDRAYAADELRQLLDEKKVYPRINADPDVTPTEEIVLRPRLDLWPALHAEGAGFLPEDIADLARVATVGRRVQDMPVNGRTTEVRLAYPEAAVSSETDVASLPIGVGPKLLPLKALASVGIERVDPLIYREDGRELFLVFGRQAASKDVKNISDNSKPLAQAEHLVEGWRKGAGAQHDPTLTVTFEDAEKDMHEALHQLAIAVGLSILLIFMTLVLQFGDIMSALLVLVAVPLGFIGVLISLWVFKSTLSLNSVLGVILLNGIAVANSIILVDFLKRLVDSGLSPEEAAVQAGRKRLRPILITSLTTILGMMPIALGLGDGGRILQPLGIAVSGGLWVSMGLTLFVVPALQVSQLRRRKGVASVEVPAADAEPGLLVSPSNLRGRERAQVPLA
jgi:HAE1 family hydrophobic/amphiphilic exporter-1